MFLLYDYNIIKCMNESRHYFLADNTVNQSNLLILNVNQNQSLPRHKAWDTVRKSR